MKKIFKIAQNISETLAIVFRRGRCPKCGSRVDDDDDVCQTCGYPDTDKR